ncbi:unnamed protein product [Aureobasidium uvarum]|uniref:Uncharacterized protein n=1 Tax=Aureobasidium uvarum TaxID=2773716 RepID=A0A9N8KYJ6_9PEZI|nr:unnamed protein product [Aureobasidium uvarum]
MVTNDLSTFWESIPSNLRNAIEQAVPAHILEERLSIFTNPMTLTYIYAQLEDLLQDMVAAETRPAQPSDNGTSTHQVDPRISALFPLAMLQTEMKHYAAAEKSWRGLLYISPPLGLDLAAMSNLIDVLNLQHKYAKAEILSKRLMPLLQAELGDNSPQYLGVMRKLMESLTGQGKKDEARQVYQRNMELVGTISDSNIKKDEVDALQEMITKINASGDLVSSFLRATGWT